MSIAIMSKVFYTDIPDLSYTENKSGKIITVGATTAKFVLLAIADSADDFGENSYNGYERLGAKTSLQRRSVMRSIKALIANGYLVHIGTSNYGTNNFKIVFDKLGEIPTSRAKIGRPSENNIGDSEANIGDSEANIGDYGATDSSLSVPNHPIENNLQENLQSPAKKNGDQMNKEEYLESTRKALERGLANNTSDYAQFPEDIVPVVEKMAKLWNFTPPTRKSKQFGFWIDSCREVICACGEFGVDLLDKLHEDWKLYMSSNGGCAPYPVSSPKSLVSAVYGKAALLRGGSNAPMWKVNKPVRQSTLDV